MVKATTEIVSQLTEEQKREIYKAMQKDVRAVNEQKAATKRGVTVEEYRAMVGEKAREKRIEALAEKHGISVDEARGRVRTRGTGVSSTSKNLISVSVPRALPADQQLARIERSIAKLQEARDALLAGNTDLSATA